MKINIPKPCPKNWNEMIPIGNGRYCDSCRKIVVDFTQMSDDELRTWLAARKQEHVCGRLNQRQLYEPSQSKKRFYQFSKIAVAAGLLVSTLACERLPFSGSETMGEITVPADSTYVLPGDSISQPTMGMVISSDTTEQ